MINKLEWDSQFFKKKIGCIDENDNTGLRRDSLEKFDLVQCCCNCNNIEYISELERNGFHYVDTRIDYLMRIDDPGQRNLHFAKESDSEQIIKIAKSIFIYSRYNNLYFKANQFRDFYAKWAKNAVLGKFDDICLIKKRNYEIAGFVTLKYKEKEVIQIGLIGISEKYQGKGCAANLLEDVKFYAAREGFKFVSVATQAVNLSAQRFYIKSGFFPEKIKQWYYYGKKQK